MQRKQGEKIAESQEKVRDDGEDVNEREREREREMKWSCFVSKCEDENQMRMESFGELHAILPESLKRKSQGKNIKIGSSRRRRRRRRVMMMQNTFFVVFFYFVTSVESLDTTRGTSIPLWEKIRSAAAATEKELGILTWVCCNNELLINNKQSWSS